LSKKPIDLKNRAKARRPAATKMMVSNMVYCLKCLKISPVVLSMHETQQTGERALFSVWGIDDLNA